MKTADFGSFPVPRRVCARTDGDGYDCMAKSPEYRSFTGSLPPGLSSPDGNRFTDALIIRPGPGGAYGPGVLLYDEDGAGCSVRIDSEGRALPAEDGDAVSRRGEHVRDLRTKADAKRDVRG